MTNHRTPQEVPTDHPSGGPGRSPAGPAQERRPEAGGPPVAGPGRSPGRAEPGQPHPTKPAASWGPRGEGGADAGPPPVHGAQAGRWGKTKADFLTILDWSPEELTAAFALASRVKALTRAGRPHRPLEGKSLAMLFQKPSLRTRVTFEIGMQQLGGIAVYLSTYDFTLDVRETVEDVARNLERWCDVIVIRTFKDETVERLARTARVPVINGLTDGHHPCQIVADLFTLYERWDGALAGRTIAFVGDGNNTATSLMEGAALAGMRLRIASPPGYELRPAAVARARAAAAPTGATITVLEDPVEAVSGADAVYTDTWVSMHQETETARRRYTFQRYQVNEALLAHAGHDALVMHCLPAHRGEELTDAVMDGPRSIIFDQAENRLHAQKAILEMLVNGGIGARTR